jgi:methionyl-tRNA formyltransferase
MSAVSALRVAFAGTPEFARVALQAILASAHCVVGVFTQPDRRRGRGQKLCASPVKEAALEAQLALSQPATMQDGAALGELCAWRADVLVVVAYGLILPQAVLDAPRLGSINVHASLLPRWRGAAPIQRAILAGDRQSGITLMRMQATLDTGPILLQHPWAIQPTDTAGTLHDALALLGRRTLLEGLDHLAAGRMDGIPQPQAGVTYAAKITKAEARIDWRLSASDIERRVRAFNPQPIAETVLAESRLRIFAGRVYEGSDNPAAAPGSVIAVHAAGPVVQCGEGALILSQVQRPGRKVVRGSEFAAGADLLGRLLG